MAGVMQIIGITSWALLSALGLYVFVEDALALETTLLDSLFDSSYNLERRQWRPCA